MFPLGLLLALPFALAQSSPVIDLGYAQYQGTVDTATNTTILLGIRYAAAPLGDLRFRAPQPPVDVAGVQQATVAPNECMQASTGASTTNPLDSRAVQVSPSEDCLFVNVYYPSDAAGTPLKDLPTLVWIHGGGYIAGQASSANGEDIIKQSNHNVVVVTIQYRLGIFGFLAGSALKNDGALNAGLLDQDFALRWVNQHITKFGGDPSKVTIWGESAGAGSVLQHVVANGGKTEPQLFRGAITSSTFLPSQYPFDDPISEFIFSEVVSGVNCTSASDALTCLRAADGSLLGTVNNNINLGGFFGTFSTVPVIDGEFITQRPTLSFLEGKVNGEALLSVTNTFEGTVFVNQKVDVEAGPYSLELFPKFTSTQADTVATLYGGLGTDLFQADAIQGESIFICPTYYMLHAFPGKSFKGEFAIPPGLHGNDVAYYFPGGVAPPFNNTDFINAFAQSFTSFIINLDPNDKVSNTITPSWNEYVLGNTEMLFNKTNATPGLPVVQPFGTSAALLERCQFWNSVGNLTGQ
ncbi:Alpha/Beta hydrolase protein [Roridomyces roridus]|uniref:Carboxylic ester hydrolase n=1 Tax=Roridomyces roridus TaxID=1738132 RepID=A0AAD7CKZ9_9AGAR|nr:Alpha/Beta hydrolase protein [Roridomyces roridus]